MAELVATAEDDHRQRATVVQNYAVQDLTLDAGSAAMAAISKLNQIRTAVVDDDSDDDDYVRAERASVASYSTAGGGGFGDGDSEFGITEEHRQYALTYGMMLGIRVSVGRLAMEDHNRRQTFASERSQTTLVEDDALMEDDFDHIDKLTFPPEGNTRPPFITPPHKLSSPFKFKDYSPKVFRSIRKHFGIEESDYMLSLAGDFNFIEFIANSHSGQFFFYSHDARYMIKTMEKSECKLLREILPDYYHFMRDQRHTLMTRFYGMHRVKMRHIRKTMHFVIMGSVFDTPLSQHIMYDLKGSTVGRLISDEERAAGKVRKDQDLIKDERRIQVGPYRQSFLDQIERDSQFLARHNIMDYSLLVGIHDMTIEEDSEDQQGKRHVGVVLTDEEVARREKDKERKSSNTEGESVASVETPVRKRRSPRDLWSQEQGGFQTRMPDGTMQNEILFMGIIDILQQYNTKKRAENFLKGFKYNRSQISAVRPDLYAQRFRDFLAANSV